MASATRAPNGKTVWFSIVGEEALPQSDESLLAAWDGVAWDIEQVGPTRSAADRPLPQSLPCAFSACRPRSGSKRGDITTP